MQHPKMSYFFYLYLHFLFSVRSLWTSIFHLLCSVKCYIKGNKALNSLVYNRFLQSSLLVTATETDIIILWGTVRSFSIPCKSGRFRFVWHFSLRICKVNNAMIGNRLKKNYMKFLFWRVLCSKHTYTVLIHLLLSIL